MRTLRSFLLDAYWSYDAIAEAEGFKSGAEKRRKNREAFLKAKRKYALTAKEKREKKLDDLQSSPKKWRNLQ